MDYRKKPLLIGIVVFVVGIPVILFSTDWNAQDVVYINPIGFVFFFAGVLMILYGLKSDTWSDGGA